MKILNHIKNVLLSFSLLFVALVSTGQETLILRGNITDKDTKEELIGVTIIELNENGRTVNGTITDINGNYTLKLSKENAQIRFSFIGYITKIENFTGQKVLTISLEADLVAIEGVEIIAKAAVETSDGFLTILAKDKIGAVSRIDLSEVETFQATSVAEAIQGRLSGLDIASATGDPGSGIKIQIRGASSILGDSKPLIIVDGLPYETTSMQDFDFSTESVDDYSTLLDIPVDNIQDIQILKDAASAAIYGSKAANGVILITTKGGVKGKPKIRYNYKMAVKNQPDQIPLLNGDQYSTLMLEALFNANNGLVFEMPDELSYNPEFEFYDEYSQNTDWLSEVTQTGFVQDHNLSISGGGENTKYYISTGYVGEKGTTLGTGLDRFSTSVKLDYKMTKKITVQSNFNYTHAEIQNVGGNIREMAYKKAPNMSIYVFDEDGNETDVYFSPLENFQGKGTSYYNPVAMANSSMANTLSERLRTALNVNYAISKGFNFKTYVVYDINGKEIREFIPQEVYGSEMNSSQSNKMTHNNGKSYDFQGRSTLSYVKYKPESSFFSSLFGGDPVEYPVKFTGTVAGDFNIKKSSTFKGSGSNSASNTLINFFAPGRMNSISSTQNTRRTISGISSAHLTLFEKYIMQATVRADGDSKFGQDKKWGVFPAFGVGWVISEMGFSDNAGWMDFLKMRASYGVNGRMPSRGDAFYARYGADNSYNRENGIELENIQLSTLKWEKTFQYDIGIDGSLFNNRFNFDIDYYYKRTEDVIIPNIKIAGSTGIGKLEFANFGEILNQGWEFMGSAKIVETKNDGLRITANFNISNNVNKVLSIPEGYVIESGSVNNNGTYIEKIEIGKPLGSFYGFRSIGVYPTDGDNVILDDNGQIIYEEDGVTPRKLRFNSPSGYIFRGGDAMYDDINRDGVIDEGDVAYIGNADPDIFGGFGLNMSYKGFYLNPYFHYVIGQDVVNVTRMKLEAMYNRDNQSTAVTRRWQKPGDITDIPRAMYNKGYNYLGSDRFVEDASFVRLKTLSLGYRFKKQQLKKLKIDDLNVYCNLYNIYTWTNYTGQDPEVGRSLKVKFRADGSTEFSGGKDNARTPPPRNVTFGLIIGF